MIYLNILIVLALLFIFFSKSRKKKNKEVIKKRMQKEILEYEYSLNGKPALALPITSKEGKRYAELNSALDDIKFAKTCFSIAKKSDGSKITYVQDKEEIPSDVIINDSLCKAAIISYARPTLALAKIVIYINPSTAKKFKTTKNQECCLWAYHLMACCILK